MNEVVHGSECIRVFTNERGTIKVDLCKMIAAGGRVSSRKYSVES